MTLPNPNLSPAERFLTALAGAIYQRPRVFFYPQVILFLVCVCFTVAKLDFSTSRNDLVGSEKRYHKTFLKFKKEFPTQEDLVVVAESDQMEKNRQFVERLGARLEAETNLFQNVIYKGDLKMLGNKALLFLSKSDLESLHKQLTDYRPFIEQFSQATNLISLIQIINTQFRLAEKKSGNETDSLIESLPALQRIIDQANASVRRSGEPPSPGITALFGGGQEAEREMYITYGNGRMYLATAQATRPDLTMDAVVRIRELVEEIRQQVPGVSVGVTGEAVLEFDEMAQSQKDTLTASILALILVGLIFVYGYQGIGRPIKATACLLVGLAYTMGYTTLVVGHLNILTITFAPMLIGLAIDFGVHLITRYEEEIRSGQGEKEAITIALVHTGQGIFTGGLTTATAFFAMAITDFKGIQEMGIIAGGGLMLSLVPMMTLLPLLLLRSTHNTLDRAPKPPNGAGGRIESLWLNRPKSVAVFTLVLSLLSVSQFRKVYFDYNLLHMQSARLPAVVFEEKLIESASNSVLFGAVVADSIDAASDLERRIRELPSVAEVKSMSSFLAEDSSPKLDLIKAVKAKAASIHFAELDFEKVDPKELSQVLYSFQGYMGAAAKAVNESEGETDLYRQIRRIWQSIQNLRTSLNDAGFTLAAAQIARYQRALLSDLKETFASLAKQESDGGLQIEDLPLALRNRFVGQTGRFLLQVYPKKDVWQREHQLEFVEQVRSIEPDVTGTPVQLLEYTSLLKESYVKAAWHALAATSLMVLIHFRSLVCMLLALVPVFVGTVWMAGIMGFAGIPFNPANIMTLPLVAGIGVTSGIHILNRFQEEGTASILGRSTGKAVFVSGLTTIAGFGSLMLAEHQGIQSLGLVMSIGTTTCMIGALTFLPALLILLMQSGWRQKKPSDNNAPTSLGFEEPRPDKTSIN